MTTLASDEIVEAVRAHYGSIAERWQVAGDNAGCGCGGGAGSCCDDGGSLYEVDVSEVAGAISGASLGCGDPIAIARLEPGQTVLDLGSGAGMDCFLAARRVGPEGRVIGVDMTPAMIERANRNKEKLGLENVEFRPGKIEALPVESDSVDVVISNCVINLSPDKAAVFREAFRVLRPGGWLAISDMVTMGRFSDEARADANAWAACVAGAEALADYVATIRAAGFVDVSVRDKGAPQVELADSIAVATAPRLFSARITARKPDVT